MQRAEAQGTQKGQMGAHGVRDTAQHPAAQKRSPHLRPAAESGTHTVDLLPRPEVVARVASGAGLPPSFGRPGTAQLTSYLQRTAGNGAVQRLVASNRAASQQHAAGATPGGGSPASAAATGPVEVVGESLTETSVAGHAAAVLSAASPSEVRPTVQRWGFGAKPVAPGTPLYANANEIDQQLAAMAKHRSESPTALEAVIPPALQPLVAGQVAPIRAYVTANAFKDIPKGRTDQEKSEAVDLALEKSQRRLGTEAGEKAAKASLPQVEQPAKDAEVKLNALAQTLKKKAGAAAEHDDLNARATAAVAEAKQVATTQALAQRFGPPAAQAAFDSVLPSVRTRAVTTADNRVARGAMKSLLGWKLGVAYGHESKGTAEEQRALPPTERAGAGKKPGNGSWGGLKNWLFGDSERFYTPKHRREMTDEEKSRDEWRYAAVSAHNSPVLGGLGSIMYERWRVMERIRDNKGRADFKKKLHLMEKNQYGSDDWAHPMNLLSMGQRGLHLVGGIANLISIICGIAAFFAPPALAVAAVTIPLGLAAHAGLALVSGILLAWNYRRMKNMTPAQKALVWPQVKRDIAKLVAGLLGVVLGSVGVGGVAGEAAKGKAGELGAEYAADFLIETGLQVTIAKQNRVEYHLQGLDTHGAVATALNAGHGDGAHGAAPHAPGAPGHDAPGHAAPDAAHVADQAPGRVQGPVAPGVSSSAPGPSAQPSLSAEEVEAVRSVASEAQTTAAQDKPLIAADREIVGALPADSSGVIADSQRLGVATGEATASARQIDALAGQVASGTTVEPPKTQEAIEKQARAERGLDEVEHRLGTPLGERPDGPLLEQAREPERRELVGVGAGPTTVQNSSLQRAGESSARSGGTNSGGALGWLGNKFSAGWAWLKRRTSLLGRRIAAAFKAVRDKVGAAVLKLVGIDTAAVELKKAADTTLAGMPMQEQAVEQTEVANEEMASSGRKLEDALATRQRG